MKHIKTIIIFVSVILLFFISACDNKTTAFSFDDASFDISLNGDNSLQANTKKDGTSYHLKITGEGASKDFESPNKVPWYVISKKISDVEIDGGITTLGSNIFTSLSFEKYIIPSSVTSIKKDAFKDNTYVYSYGSNIDNKAKINLYYYSEAKPATPGNYFKMVGDEPFIWNSYKILFIGNSFTYYPYSVDNPAVPALFSSIALDLGIDITVDWVVKGSHTLTKYSNASDEMGAIVDEKLRESDDYDFIVLQEQSTTPIEGYDSFYSAVRSLKTKINSTQKFASIYLYSTWGFPDKITGTGNYESIPVMEKAIRDAYTTCANELDLKVSNVGKAFTTVYERNKDISLYGSDNKHQSLEGAYLSALVHLSTILDVDVRATSYEPDIESSTATILKNVAYEVAFNKEPSSIDPINTEEKENEITENSIVIAWYKKTDTSKIDQTLINSVSASLKEYLKSEGIDDSTINNIVFKGYEGNVASSTGEIINDGYVSIMLGWGTIENITSTKGVIPSSSIVKSVEDLKVKEANRSVVLLKNTTIADMIYEYFISENGRRLFE